MLVGKENKSKNFSTRMGFYSETRHTKGREEKNLVTTTHDRAVKVFVRDNNLEIFSQEKRSALGSKQLVGMAIKQVTKVNNGEGKVRSWCN